MPRQDICPLPRRQRQPRRLRGFSVTPLNRRGDVRLVLKLLTGQAIEVDLPRIERENLVDHLQRDGRLRPTRCGPAGALGERRIGF